MTEFSSPARRKAPASAPGQEGTGLGCRSSWEPRTMTAQWSLIWGRLGAEGLCAKLPFPQPGTVRSLLGDPPAIVAPSPDDSLRPQMSQPGVKKGQAVALAAARNTAMGGSFLAFWNIWTLQLRPFKGTSDAQRLGKRGGQSPRLASAGAPLAAVGRVQCGHGQPQVIHAEQSSPGALNQRRL